MTEKLRIGIAGYGVVGRRRHRVIDEHPRLKTVAVCDRTFDGDGTLDSGARFYDHYAKLLEEDLDALFVCISNDKAADVTIAGLEKGLHVFCEKPPGRDLDDIARVIACEAKHPNQTLKYGFNHRYHDSVRDALALVNSGDLGEVLNLRGVYGKSQFISFGADTDWRIQRDLAGGGILLDQGIHMVDLLRLFAGEFCEIHSFVSNDFWGHDVEDNAWAMMRTADGKVAMLHSSATQWRHRFQLDITLRRGTIILSGILSGTKSYGAETLTVATMGDDDRGDPKETRTRYNHDPSWADEIAEFADAVLDGKPIQNGSSREALKTMHLVYRIYCADPEWRERWNLSDKIPDLTGE
jgi:predicted dehydrogenase